MKTQKKYFVLCFIDGKWKRTNWTCSSDAFRKTPAKGRTEAIRCLALAKSTWPNEKYKLEAL